LHRPQQHARDRILRLTAIQPGDAVAPLRQQGKFGVERAFVVGDIVNDARTGIVRLDGMAAIRRQHAHALVERRAGGAHARFHLVQIRLRGT